MLLIDTREKGNLHKKLAKTFTHEYRALGAGDFWIPKDDGYIICERSTYSDFIGKIKSGRLKEQSEKCLSKSDDVYFILENPTMMRYSKMPYQSVIGSAMSLTRHGVKLITTRNSSETFHVIKYLYDKYNTDRNVEVGETRVKPRSMTPHEQAVYALMGLTGIGEVTSKLLLKDTSIKDLVDYVVNGKNLTSGVTVNEITHKRLKEVFTAET